MTPEEVTALFTHEDGSYQFARWGRPIAPVIFGVAEESLAVLKGAIEAVVTLAGHKMTDVDTEIGANLMVFFLKDWNELTDTPNLEKLIPDLPDVVARLLHNDANQYRSFRFDKDGGIQACFVFVRMDANLAKMPADTLALSQMVQAILLWSDKAFRDTSPLAKLSESGAIVLRPEIGDVIRAAYDPILPVSAQDASHALRLFARMGAKG